jgi:hypothetical protein
MTLNEWLDANGYWKPGGGIQRLRDLSGVSLPAIGRARWGKASLASAIKLSAATEGRVRISSMTRDEVPTELEPRRRKRVA